MSTISNPLRLVNNTPEKRETRASQQTAASVAKSEQSQDSLVSARVKSPTQPESKAQRSAFSVAAGIMAIRIVAEVVWLGWQALRACAYLIGLRLSGMGMIE